MCAAICNFGTMAITNSTFSANTAGTAGVIFTAGTATISNSTFNANTTTNAAGAITNVGKLTLYDTIVDGNTGTDVTNASRHLHQQRRQPLRHQQRHQLAHHRLYLPGHSEQQSRPRRPAKQRRPDADHGRVARQPRPRQGQSLRRPRPPISAAYTRNLSGAIDIGAFENQSQLFTISSPTPPIPSPDTGNAATFYLGSFTYTGSSNIWIVTVNWGDGTTNHVFSTTSQGSLGTLNHTYTTAGSPTVTVTVSDADNNFQQTTFSVTVHSAITFGTTSLPVGTVGDMYNTSLGVSGGSGSYTFGTTGNLDGLSVNSSGAPVGNPTGPGTFLFTVTATDTGGSASQTYVLVVNVGGPSRSARPPCPSGESASPSASRSLPAAARAAAIPSAPPAPWTV